MFEFADALKDSGKYCATICASDLSKFISQGPYPSITDDTATVTFIEFEGGHYAVTANHVIETFREAAGDEWMKRWVPFVPKAPAFFITRPFIQAPIVDVHPPDIAISRINPTALLKMGKKFFCLTDKQPKAPVLAALATGFPTAGKALHASGAISLEGVDVVAQSVGSSPDSDQMQFYSDVDPSKLRGDVSGMSGGPVFWSEGEEFGLLGVVKEALSSDTGVSIMCQRIKYDDLTYWVKRLPL